MNLASITPPLASSTTSTSLLAERKGVNRPAGSDVTKQTAPIAASESAPQPPQNSIEEAVKKVNEFVNPINNSLSFNIDEESGQTVIKVIDLTTKEVIRQIPSEEMLAIAKALDTMKGLLVQQKA